MRQVQAFAMTSDEKEDDEEDEKEERKQMESGQSAAQWGRSAAFPEALEDAVGGRRTERGQLLHSVVFFHSFLCLFTHLLPIVVHFSTWPSVAKSAHCIYKCDCFIRFSCLVEAEACWLYKVKDSAIVFSVLRLWHGLLLQHREDERLEGFTKSTKVLA